MKRHHAFTAALFASASLLVGCTSLKVHRLTQESKDTDRLGLTYYLPLKQFTVVATFEVTNCTPQNDGVRLEYDLSSKVYETQIPDMSERYSISYRDLAAITKTTELTANLSDQGLLVSINAAATDLTGPVLVSAVQAGLGFARGSAMSALGVVRTSKLRSTKRSQPPADDCFEVASRLNDIANAKAAVALAEAEDEQRVSAAAQRLKAATALVAADAKLKEALQSGDTVLISEARTEVRAKDQALTAAMNVLKELGASQTARMTADLIEKQMGLMLTRTAIWTPLSGRDEQKVTINVPASSWSTLGFKNQRLVDAGIQLRAEVVLGGLMESEKKAIPAETALSALAGLVYRQPAHVLLRVCAQECEAVDASGAYIAEQYAYAAVHAVPQYGIKASLPLTNALFEDNSLSVSFGDSGQPKGLTFKNKASADRAASSAKEIGKSYQDFVMGRETDRLEFQKNLRADQEGQLALESALRDAKVDTLSTRLDVIKKLEALEAVREGSATKAQLAEASLEARKRQLKLLIEIKEQEMKLQELGATLPQ